MAFQRYRLRFRKQGDQRFLSHRDLVRTFERAFRRAVWPLRMSEGFHPKPRMSFPSALAVGIAGQREILELELTDAGPVRPLLDKIGRQLPRGIEVASMDPLPVGTRKGVASRFVYELPVRPESPGGPIDVGVERLMAMPEIWVDRANRATPTNIRPFIERLERTGSRLGMVLRMTGQGSARPREVLNAIGLGDLEQTDCYLTRVLVELTAATRSAGPDS